MAHSRHAAFFRAPNQRARRTADAGRVAANAAAAHLASEDIMAPALALRHEHAVAHMEALPTRDEVLARYRSLREISRRHNSAMTNLVSMSAMLEQARRLGLANGKTFILDSWDDMNYVLDLAIHTAPAGRTR